MCVCVCVCLWAQLCLTRWDPVDLACQSPLSMEFSRQEYWSRLLFPTPEYLPDPGIRPRDQTHVFLNWQVGSLPLSHQEKLVGDLEQQKLTLSQFWRSEVSSQAQPPLRLTVVAPSLQSLPPSSYPLLPCICLLSDTCCWVQGPPG